MLADFSSAEFNDKSMAGGKQSHVTSRDTTKPLPPPQPAARHVTSSSTTSAAGTGASEHLITASVYGTNPLPPALNTLLETYKHQLLTFLHYMQTSSYREQLERDISTEKTRNAQLRARVEQLEAQMGNLQRESMTQLKSRLSEVKLSH